MNPIRTWKTQDTNKDVIIGGKDDVVNPIKTIEWLQTNRPDVNIMIQDDMTHSITIDEFIKVIERVLGREYQWKR